jgi:hypothetical protein
MTLAPAEPRTSREEAGAKRVFELGRLHDETQQAVEDNDLEAIGVLTAKAHALEQQLGPEYDNVIDGLLSSAEEQELADVFKTLQEKCE